VSPWLAQVALDGMARWCDAEEADGRPNAPGLRKGPNKGLAVMRSGDDCVPTAPTRAVWATSARPRLEQVLHARGLARSAATTRIGHLTEGLHCLGFHSRQCGTQGKWLPVPPKEKVLKHVRATRAYLAAPKQTPAGQGSKARNPVIRGWAHDSRYGAATHVLHKVRQAQWQLLWRLGETPPPEPKQAMGESPLFPGRRVVDMLGRKGGTGSARRHPEHTLPPGHREACPL